MKTGSERERSSAEIEPLAGRDTLGVLYMPSDYVAPRRGILALWRRHVVANANVRNREYMESLFRRRFPYGALVEVKNGAIPSELIDASGSIVLLFPDAIGLDFARIEQAISTRWPSKRLLALNGRRRLLRLDRQTRRQFLLCRFLEKWRLPEIAFFVLFVVVTPFLLIFDLMRGHR